MSEHSIFGEAAGTGRGSRSLREGEIKRPKAAHGLFGAHLLPTDRSRDACDDDEGDEDLPVSRS
jgi:hypothetical protein